MPPRKSDSLVGQRFGRLTVTRYRAKKNEHGIWMHECACDCGNIVYRRSYSLLSKKSTSCGCALRESPDIVGKRFGKLVVVRYVNGLSTKNDTLCECACDCGNTKIVRYAHLDSGGVKSCGCLLYDPVATKKRMRWQDDFLIDGTHIDSLDRKMSSANKSGVRGVSWDKRKRKWFAQIKFKRTRYFLGLFDSLEDAKKAREIAEEKYWGDLPKLAAEIKKRRAAEKKEDD